MAATLLERLLDLVPEPARARLAERPGIGRELDELYAQAQARWPDLAIDDRVLWSEVASRIDGTALPDPGAFAEIYLAVACAAGGPAALAAFEAAYLAGLAGVLGRFQLAPGVLDEIKQVLRVRLLVGSPPRIVGYAGRGGLHRLITVAAVRLAIDHAGAIRGDDVDLGGAPAAVCDPELQYMQRAYAGVFKTAFERAVAELSTRERTLLRLHIVDGLCVDDIAAIYGLHRASAARRVEAARQAVARSVRRHLRSAGIDRDQLEEAFALVSSQLDLSVTRVLRVASPDERRALPQASGADGRCPEPRGPRSH